MSASTVRLTARLVSCAALSVLAACRGGEAGRSGDSNTALLGTAPPADTGRSTRQDTAGGGSYGFSHKPHPAKNPSLAEQERKLDSAALTVRGLDTLRANAPAIVTAELLRLRGSTKLPPAPKGSYQAMTKVGDDATVCLLGDSAQFRIAYRGAAQTRVAGGACARNSVSYDEKTPWVFEVTALDTGRMTLEVRVVASFIGYSDLPLYDSTYAVVVRVGKGPSFLERISKWLADATHTLWLVVGLLTAVAALVAAWRRLVGRDSREGAEPGIAVPAGVEAASPDEKREEPKVGTPRGG